MKNLPALSTIKQALEYYQANQNCLTDAQKAYIVGTLSHFGFSNKQIRHFLAIKKVYTVTHLKRAGTTLTLWELTLWHHNPSRITLGHVRAITKFPIDQRKRLLENLLVRKIPVYQFERLAQGKAEQPSVDIKRYERIMSEILGRQINIRFNPVKQYGSITLDFSGLSDLDDLSLALGFNANNHL